MPPVLMMVWAATPAAVLLGTLAVTVDKRLMSVNLTLVKIKAVARYVIGFRVVPVLFF